MAEQRTVLFSGDVQGVGFRATTQRLAADVAITGTVRNLSDGRVELIAEGEPAEIDHFIKLIREQFGPMITDTASTTAEASDTFEGFRIRH